MKIAECLTGAAIAALLCVAPASAQEQKRNEGMQNTPPAPTTEPKQGKPVQQPPQRNSVETPKSAPNSTQRETPREQMKGAQTGRDIGPQEKAPASKSNAQNGKQAPQVQDKAAAPQEKSAPKRAETPSNDRKGSAERQDTPAAKSAGKLPGEKHVQLSSQQRTDIHRDVLKERNVNRVKVRVDVNVGGRVPRNVHLAVLPAAIVAIVPAYRAYRYFVVDERVYIVEPRTYEVVDVIVEPGHQVAARSLSLTAQERQILLSEVDLTTGGRSTLGLGALSEGSPVPRNVEILPMPVTVVERVPRLEGFKYFIADERIAIVDPPGGTVQLLIDIHR